MQWAEESIILNEDETLFLMWSAKNFTAAIVIIYDTLPEKKNLQLIHLWTFLLYKFLYHINIVYIRSRVNG